MTVTVSVTVYRSQC